MEIDAEPSAQVDWPAQAKSEIFLTDEQRALEAQADAVMCVRSNPRRGSSVHRDVVEGRGHLYTAPPEWAALRRVDARPTALLYSDAEHVLRYLHGTRDLGLRYEASERPLFGMSDSDWAVRHSTGGFVFNFCRAAVSWSSKKQPTVALSSCEAELMALSEAAKEAIYLDEFVKELGISTGEPVSLGCDNQAAGDLAPIGFRIGFHVTDGGLVARGVHVRPLSPFFRNRKDLTVAHCAHSLF